LCTVEPELGQDRIKEYYELKGYPKEWKDTRLRGIAIRQELKDSANKGGNIARRAREDLEKNLGNSIVSEDNFLENPQRKKKLG
jgi:hypothetical protein